jgi:hypothetical protein
MTDEQPTLFGPTPDPASELKPWQRPAHLDREPKKLARREDPDTSKAAAEALAGKAGSMRRRLLQVYASRLRLTAEGAATLAGFTPADGAWKRVSDLLNLGLIYDTGEHAPSPTTGRQQRLLAITELGLAMADRVHELRYAEGPA